MSAYTTAAQEQILAHFATLDATILSTMAKHKAAFLELVKQVVADIGDHCITISIESPDGSGPTDSEVEQIRTTMVANYMVGFLSQEMPYIDALGNVVEQHYGRGSTDGYACAMVKEMPRH